METNAIPAWLYVWKCLYWQLLSVCQISCLCQKVHNSPEISSYAAGLEEPGIARGLYTAVLYTESSEVQRLKFISHYSSWYSI